MPKKKKKIFLKIKNRRLAIGLIGFLIFIAVYIFLALISNNPLREPELGITFSKKHAQSLELDWKKNYTALLDELGVRYIRIPTYWNDVEPREGEFNFEDVDWMVGEAAKRNAKVVMVLGMRQPRWPECHFPEWTTGMRKEVLQHRVQELIIQTVERYKDNPTIEVWQVENEPLLEFFGECPLTDQNQLLREIELVRAIDDRPIMITASGELSLWYPEALWGDILGTTMYRTTWNETLSKAPGYDGFWSYWFVPPSWYRIKAFILGQGIESFWIAELQAEPWFPGDPLQTSVEDMYKSMSPRHLKANIEYAKSVNPGRIYLWGAEWWYYMREKREVNEIWDEVRKLNW